MQAQETLRKYFGHEAFRPGQEVMVNALTHHRDALGVMPTGAGKSMCYQVPALMMPGVAIVISPLISLMADQVAALKSAGVPAAYLNSSLTPRQMELAMQRARQGAYKIIYVAPERLETPSFQAMAQSMPISLLAVDEAHCVSQWGQDFRPVYLRIADFVDSLPTRPVLGAFTATATERVRQDIIRLLRLQNPETVTTGFDRPNLYFEVIRPKNRDAALMDILRRKRGESGIVYCATRKAVEQVCDNLIRAGIDATRYHAGLSDEERKENQEKFQYDTCPVMVATNAFGMGIDKSNVRFVIHYQMPRSMEAYYQEAGRAGRDGEAAECILLYNGSDIFTAKWMIEHTEPNENMTAAEQSAVRYQDMNRLNRMVDYCTKPGCLRAFILRYFGENTAQDCGHCSACCGARYGEAEGIARQRRRGADGAHLGQQATAEKIGSIGIVSDIEHPAVKESAKWLSEHGFEVSYAPVNAQGFVDVEALAGLLRPDTILVSVMAVNNEIGSIQPIQEISALLANEPTISFHVDAVQAIGKIPVSAYLTDRVDFATFSGHKFHAVRGVGFVYKKAGKKITPLLTGGGQEKDFRSTTENVAGIASMAKALRLVTDKEEFSLPKIAKMKKIIFDELAKYEDITIFSGEGEDFAPNILTFGIKGVRGEVIVHAFEEHQIYISTTSACSSKAGKPAGTLISMGVPTKLAQTAVRISLDDDNDMGQVEQFLTIFKQVYAKTQKVR